MKKIRKQISKFLFLKTPKQKVNLFIVGEQKCGTSSLHGLLKVHSQIASGIRKELHYFDRWKNEGVSIKEYQSWFAYDKRFKSPKYLLDASPSYATTDGCLESIFNYNPEAKIIYLTRNPVERFVSAYSFYFNNGRTFRNDLVKSNFIKNNPDFSFSDFFQLETGNNPLFNALARGNYTSMIDKMNLIIPGDQIFVSSLENMVNDKTKIKVLSNLFNWLKIEEYKDIEIHKINESKSNRVTIMQREEDWLINYYNNEV